MSILRFVVYLDPAEEYRWNFKDTNGRCHAVSPQGYSTKAECLANLQSCREVAPIATVKDLT